VPLMQSKKQVYSQRTDQMHLTAVSNQITL